MTMERFSKMFKISSFTALLTGYCLILISQDDLTTPSNIFIDESHILAFHVDKLNNIYTINQNGELIKYDQYGTNLYTYADRTLGIIDHLDVQNPLKLLAFYRDFQYLIFLDNTLSVTARFDLPELGFQDATAVGLSNDNNIWIYDGLESRLKKIDHDGKVLIESNVLTPYLNDLNPDFILENSNYLLVNDPENGIHLFDTFGKYINTVKVTYINNFQLVNNKVIFVKDDIIQGWDIISYQRDSFFILDPSPKNMESIHLLRDDILILKEGNIIKMKIK